MPTSQQPPTTERVGWWGDQQTLLTLRHNIARKAAACGLRSYRRPFFFPERPGGGLLPFPTGSASAPGFTAMAARSNIRSSRNFCAAASWACSCFRPMAPRYQDFSPKVYVNIPNNFPFSFFLAPGLLCFYAHRFTNLTQCHVQGWAALKCTILS
jgi:hypothetical protein